MEVELLDAKGACEFLGGSKPINAATLYRGVASGLYPKPIRVSPNSSRWIKAELEAARARRIAARDSEVA